MIDLNQLNYKHLGAWVRFDYQHGESEYGRIKTWNEKYVFVVFKCNGDWDNWNNYTSQSCAPDELTFEEPKEIDPKKEEETNAPSN